MYLRETNFGNAFWQNKIILTNLVEVHPRAICVKLFQIGPVVFDNNVAPFSCHGKQNSARFEIFEGGGAVNPRNIPVKFGEIPPGSLVGDVT